LPWQTWPHVNPAEENNEMLIEVKGDEILVRLNRELLWEGSGFVPTDRVGLFTTSFGAKTTTEFGRVALYAQQRD
jgi:hypothetical protein